MGHLYEVLDPLLGLSADPTDLTVLQMSARALVIFVSALFMLRLAHKRFFAQRNVLDVLLSLIIASTLARAINGSAAFFPTIAVGFLLILVHRAVGWCAARSSLIGLLVKGRSTVLIENGRIHERLLARHDLSREDLVEDLRIQGVEQPAQVRLATLERNGEVSVIKAS